MFAAYVHIPFCKQKCFYCDFNSVAGFSNLYDRYVDALIDEINVRAHELKNRVVDTLYIGGGTPTIIGSDRVAGLLDSVKQSLNIAPDIEITVETNPETITLEDMTVLREASVNRISIGFQSMDDENLRTLGRKHSAQRAMVSFFKAREAGFKNINVDLIFGIPGQSLAGWALCLEQVVALNPDHISCYCLTVENGTLIKKSIDDGVLDRPEESIQADMMVYTIESLLDSGFEHYEISNFSKPGMRCGHNLIYWNNEDYMGFGAGAHSKIDSIRYGNVNNPEKYIESVTGATDSFIESRTVISPEEEISDAVFLGLRKTEGIAVDEIDRRYGCNITGIYGSEIGGLIDSGLLLELDGRLRLSRKGVLLGNEVFTKFV